MHRRLLETCARIEGHAEQYARLRRCALAVNDWRLLLNEAAQQGLTPLLVRHLEASQSTYPAWVRRSFHLIKKQHRRRAELYQQVLLTVLDLFAKNGLRCLVLKGSVLAHTLYPEPALRPMRDIDLFVRKAEADHAQNLLITKGFVQKPAIIPADHFHLPPLFYRVGGTSVCIEIHRGLYPHCPPFHAQPPFDHLFDTGKTFTIGNTEATTFSDRETLPYLYRHALHSPLTYEPFKLINIADIIGFTEAHYTTLNWRQMGADCPLLITALPLLGHIVSWDKEKVGGWLMPKNFYAPAPYAGWPLKRWKACKVEGITFFQILRRTLLPSRWWLKLYYGAASTAQELCCLLWKHPRHLCWWLTLFHRLKK